MGAFVRTIYKKENTLNRQARKKLVEIVVNEVINRRRDSHKYVTFILLLLTDYFKNKIN